MRAGTVDAPSRATDASAWLGRRCPAAASRAAASLPARTFRTTLFPHLCAGGMFVDVYALIEHETPRESFSVRCGR